ncbi:MAG: hypothetical protein GXO87_04785 [Chlorobi bacterium]|nr:hypothetical protein [Chlorobiota bacterium]
MNKTIVNFLLFFLLFGLFSKSSAQISLVPGNGFNVKNADSLFFDISKTRKAVFFSDGWKVYPKDEPEKAVSASVPSYTNCNDELVYEKKFELTAKEISFYDIELVFLGVNYTAEVLINDVVVYKHLGGLFPFSVTLPSDILKSSEPNSLKVIIQKGLDSQTSIPLAQRFLFPKNKGGILRDVYFHFTPKSRIEIVNVNSLIDEKKRKADIKIDAALIEDAIFDADTANIPSRSFSVKFKLLRNGISIDSSLFNGIIIDGGSRDISWDFVIANPKLRASNNSNKYVINCKFFSGSKLIDETSSSFSLGKIVHTKEATLLNGKKVAFDGATYLESSPDGGIISPDQIENDLNTIKAAGFNSVRFAKHLPNPYAVYYADKIGLFTFLELPLNSLPDEFLDNQSFRKRVNDILKTTVKAYSEFTEITGFGLGGSFLSNSPAQLEFVDKLAETVKSESGVLTFASFIGFPKSEISNLDLIGVELYAVSPSEIIEKFADAENLFGRNRILISEATYPTYYGSANGSLNKFSIEGQAKFIDDVISFSNSEGIAGYFLNSMFDYKGDFTSFFASYDKDNLYKIGILNETRKADRITFKLLESRLKGGEKVTIPLGSKKDNSPVLFIILGVLLSIFMALLINSKRKFREDATRALLRPYNFFADIRDLRIFSGIHTIILMLVISATFSLLVDILLFHWKNNLLMEKVVLSFNWAGLSKTVSFLAWHPLEAFFILFGVSVLLLFIHVAVIKFGSFFVKTRVIVSNVFYTVVWAFMPLTLLLPLELILHRLLEAQIANLYIFGFIALFLIWLLQRLLKGIYVIFDVRGIVVYTVSVLFFVFAVGGILVYFQLADSTLFYIINAFKQYRLL